MPGSVLLSHEEPHTIIGAVWFHFRVRDGIGWVTYAIAARQKLVAPPQSIPPKHKLGGNNALR